MCVGARLGSVAVKKPCISERNDVDRLRLEDLVMEIKHVAAIMGRLN